MTSGAGTMALIGQAKNKIDSTNKDGTYVTRDRKKVFTSLCGVRARVCEHVYMIVHVSVYRTVWRARVCSPVCVHARVRLCNWMR